MSGEIKGADKAPPTAPLAAAAPPKGKADSGMIFINVFNTLLKMVTDNQSLLSSMVSMPNFLQKTIKDLTDQLNAVVTPTDKDDQAALLKAQKQIGMLNTKISQCQSSNSSFETSVMQPVIQGVTGLLDICKGIMQAYTSIRG
jgi:hypothetical protein